MKLDLNIQDAQVLPTAVAALAEGLVGAAIAEIDGHPDPESLPCCCACGEFLPTRRIWELADGYVGPTATAARGNGNPLSLAVYQVAQARREGKTAQVVVWPVWPIDADSVQLGVVINDRTRDMVEELHAKAAERQAAAAAELAKNPEEDCGCGSS